MVQVVISCPVSLPLTSKFCHQPKEFLIGTEEFHPKKSVGKKEKTATKKMTFCLKPSLGREEQTLYKNETNFL